MRDERGFTLIELLIALSLFAFMISGTAELISLSLMVKRKAEIQMEIVQIMTDKLEGLRCLSFDDEGLSPGILREIVDRNDGAGCFLLEWGVENISSSMKRIEVTARSLGRDKSEGRTALLVSERMGF